MIDCIFQNSFGDTAKYSFESFEELLEFIIDNESTLISWRKKLN